MEAFGQIVPIVAGILVIIGTLLSAVGWTKGIFPALWRLGMGLAKRQIAIFAQSENMTSLELLLTKDSGLFKQENLVRITIPGDMARAQSATLWLLHWADWKGNIGDVLSKKQQGTALIVYAAPGEIPREDMTKIGETMFTTVCNFRGRLVNDIVVSMITTNYKAS